MKRIGIVGANGQLGKRLVEALGTRAVPITRVQMDLTQLGKIPNTLNSWGLDALINASAYTNVELAEDEETLAHTINADAPWAMANYASQLKIPFIHISTDYVFDGTKQGAYVETDATNPINAYGRSKLAGERGVLEANPNAIIARVSWLYDAKGKNFLNAIINKARTTEELNVVADQFGAPCFARDIARTLVLLLDSPPTRTYRGLLHVVNAGETTWHGFATAIVEEMKKHEKPAAQRINPVGTEAYPTKAQRPKNSRLSTDLLTREFAITLPDWQNALTRCMDEVYASH